MDVSTINIVISAVAGLLAGAIGSLFAPWAQWGVEKKREKMNYRRKQIERWRAFLNDEFEQLAFSDTAVYSELRPHLSKETIDSIENNTVYVRVGRGGNLIKSLVLDDITKLEKEWNLI